MDQKNKNDENNEQLKTLKKENNLENLSITKELQIKEENSSEKERINHGMDKELHEVNVEKRGTNIQDINLISNNMIFMIPSWGELLGYPHKLGFYMNKEVTKIHTDLIIFFSGIECRVKTTRGISYFLFGIGYYYTKFELSQSIDLTRGV